MKIGLLGGSFDPIHFGHLNMAISAYEEYDLNQVWIIPAGHSPNKDETKMTSSNVRYEMCKLACENYDFLMPSDFEICSEERSYTYRTLEKLSLQYPEHKFYFIMGADSLDYFDKWVHPEIICKLAHILVVNRDEFTENDLLDKIHTLQQIFLADINIVHSPKIDISSHEIRDYVKYKENISNYVPEKVRDYILQNNLYQ